MRSTKTRVLGQFILAFAILTTAIFGAQLDSTFRPVVSGTYSTVLDAVQRTDGKIVVAGSFRIAGGKRRNRIAILNSDGTADSSFDIGMGTNSTFAGGGAIDAIAVQSDNKIIIGGSFDLLNGIAQNAVARLNPDGSVDTSFNVGQGFGGQVLALAIQPDGKIIAVGGFGTYNSQATGNVVRLNMDGTRDTSFTGVTTAAQVFDVTIQPDGKIVVVGGTMTVNGTQRRGVARLNTDGTLDTSFNPGTGTTGVRTVQLQGDGKVVLGGGFTTFNGSANLRSIVRLNTDGTVDNSFVTVINPGGVQQFVYSISLLPNGQFIIGGDFTNVNGTSRARIARLNADGTLDSTFITTTNHDGNVFETYVLSDQRILIGGGFNTVNDSFRVGVAALNPDGSLSGDFSQGASHVGLISDIVVQENGQILIGGSFTHVNGQIRRSIARYNPDGSQDATFNSGSGVGSDGSISAIAAQSDGKVIIGGNITTYNGAFRGNLTRLNPDGSVEENFPQGVTLNGYVNDLVIQSDNKILVGGSIFQGIRRLTPSGAPDPEFNATLGGMGTVYSIQLQPDGKIIIGGGFSYNNSAVCCIARLNANGSLDNAFNPGSGFNGSVYDLALQPDGKVIAVGDFTTFNGSPVNRVVRLNSNGTIDQSFSAGTGTTDLQISAVELQPDGKVIIGGFFDSYNGTSRKKLVRLLPNGNVDPGFADFEWYYEGTQPNVGAVVFSLALSNNNLFVGGVFTEIDGVRLASLAKIKLNKPAPYDFDGDGKSDISVWRASTGSWWYLQSSNLIGRGHSFGLTDDIITPGDFTGDGKWDVAIWRPTTGEWFVRRSEDGSYFAYSFGLPGDIPAPADYDGDGITDTATFRPSTATWYIFNSGSSTYSILTFGLDGDKPVPADYDGDGKADIATWRPSNGTWWIVNSSNLEQRGYGFGQSMDKPVVGGDYTGDGKADIALWRPSTSEWYFLRSEDGSYYSYPSGLPGDIPAPGDYDGDGRFDSAVFRPSTQTWYIDGSTAGSMILTFGLNGDRPIANAPVP